MNNIYALESATTEQIIIKVKKGLSLLDIAKHPYLQKDYRYITVRRGAGADFTVVKEDGTTHFTSWGWPDYRTDGGDLDMMKSVIHFLRTEYGIDVFEKM